MTDSYNLRPIGVTLVAREHHIRGFRATQWQIDSLVPGDEGDAEPTAITASQDVAADWMDGEQQVLEAPMPLAIQVWIEAYLARHGEAPMEERKKKRKGAGRAREMDA